MENLIDVVAGEPVQVSKTAAFERLRAAYCKQQKPPVPDQWALVSRDDLMQLFWDWQHKLAAFACFKMRWNRIGREPLPDNSRMVLVQRLTGQDDRIVEVIEASYHSGKNVWFDSHWRFLTDTGNEPLAWREMIALDIDPVEKDVKNG